MRKSASAATATSGFDSLDDEAAALSPVERDLLDNVGDSLARLGRVKRVGLGVQEKKDFVRMWTKVRRTW